ncbi:MAG: OmpH family outer membrane protein [bacterium]
MFGKGRIVLIASLAAAAISFIGTGAFAQDIKFGYIDSQRIFLEYRETQEAERVYKKEVDQWKAEAAAKEQEIAKLQEELRAQSLMLSEEKQKEKKLELDKKLEDYQQFVAETFGEEGIAAQRNRELTQPIVDRINRILERLSEEEGYSMVFDIANANIVYAKKEFDLTERVLAELNQAGQQ